MARSFYRDGRYTVTAAIIATPGRFYPLANTTASLRRDPLWFGLGIAVLITACLAVYGDLLRPIESASLIVIASLALLIGWQIAVLRLDAPGHKRVMIVDRQLRLTNLYEAIRDARSIDVAIILDSENDLPI